MSKVKLTATTGGGSTSLEAPNATTGNANVSWKLPVGDGGANEFLKTNGSGVLSWASVTSNLLQVKIDTQGNSEIQSSYTSTTLADMNSVTITPAATSSKFLIYATYRGFFNGNGNVALKTGLVRNVAGGGFTELFSNDYDSYLQTANIAASQHLTHFYLDAPTYSAGNALIYKSQAASSAGTALDLGRFTELVVAELASGTA